MRSVTIRATLILLCASSFVVLDAFQTRTAWPPPVQKTAEKSPALSAEEEQKTFVLPPGYRAELVAKEPLVIDPIAIDFDADGRLWVLEMPGFMSEPGALNSREPINTVAVLQDRDGDGVMDTRTVFADKLILARALKVLDRGVLVGEPPNLWLMRDTDGDFKADTKELVNGTYGRGEAGIEHNANSLYWALDNVIYTSEHDWHLRLRKGAFEIVPTLSRGQWGATQDDAGRIYRNVNDAPLFVDFVPARYYARNPNLVRTRGLYDPLISREASTIWPIRQTRGVNRGYRDQFFRPDGSSVTIQGVGTPVIYRGDNLPKELYGDAFITDSTTNLVHRYKIVDDGTGRLHAIDGYRKGEILASSDERFRPVNMLGGPDGALYVVDMYRGVVQEAVYWTDYLREYVKERDLEKPVKLGRIWRIVHDTTRRVRAPRLSTAPPAELVQALSHANGWWRDTAQQLLVQRGETSVVPQLKQLAAQSPDWRARLHALWTLDGLDAIEPAQVERALADKSADVRASALRLSERWLREPNHPLAGGRPRADGRLELDRPPSACRDNRRAAGGSAARGGRRPADPLRQRPDCRGRHGQRPARTRGRRADAVRPGEDRGPSPDVVTMLAGAIARSGDAAGVQQVLARATDAGAVPWQRTALLQGLEAGLAGGGGRGGGRGRGAPAPRVVSLPAEPTEITRLAAAGGDTGAIAARVAARLDWPGKPAPPAVAAPPLTADEQKLFVAGSDLYKGLCVACHQEDGKGREKLAPSLVGSRFVVSPDPGLAARILLGGKEGVIGSDAAAGRYADRRADRRGADVHSP